MTIVVVKYVGALFIFVAAYWTVLFLMQRRVMFPAPAPLAALAPPRDVLRVWVGSAGDSTEAWFLPPTTRAVSSPPLIIFAHGNGELIDHWPDEFDEPRQWGAAVLLVEYPGYGRSGGKPSEATIGATFRAAYDWAIEHGGVDPDRIVGYGRSLGGGAVAGLSGQRRLAAMILESSFTSTRPFARRFGAPGFLVRDPFDNIAAVEAFGGSLLVIHGAYDEIIPTEHGRTLARVGGVAMHELPCGHNDCARPWTLIKQFLVDAKIVTPIADEN